jgi:molybdopterin-guanine dinucleotide biosynthesis protein A
VSASESHELSLEAHETKVSDSEVFAGNGPISGVLSVHLEAPNKSLLVMGVDYPYLQEYALNRLVSAYRVSGRSVCFAPSNADSKLPVRNQIEPLVALYAPSDLQSLLLYFKRGGRSLRTFLIESQALVLPYDEKMGLTSVDHPQQKPS